jgi:hypothetical protein
VIADVRADIGKSYRNVDAALNAMADAGLTRRYRRHRDG